VRNAAGHVDLDQPLAATGLTTGAAPGPAFVATPRDVDASFAAVIAATPRRPVAFVLYFRSEAADITPASRSTLAAAIAAVKAQPNVDVSVVGHTDAAGTDAFNLELSLRRVRTIRDALVQAGVPASVIELAYHGASNPLVATPPDGHQPLNRRVEVTVR
jgi:outer membrane protein OmpA-like peptidoglycan-associated protein